MVPRPLEIYLKSDVDRRQILTYKDGPRAEKDIANIDNNHSSLRLTFLQTTMLLFLRQLVAFHSPVRRFIKPQS